MSWDHLSALSADATSQLNVLWHDGDALGVDGTQVGVFKQTNKISLRCLLQRKHGGGLKAKVILKILSDFTNKALEGGLADQQLSGLLIFAA